MCTLYINSRRTLSNVTLKSRAGFTLVEVLIALVVLSVGLIGLAGMQLNGLSSNTTAYQRTQAMLLVYDMADRLRANSTGVANGNYDAIASSNSYGAQSCINSTGGCSAALIAQNDAAEWLAELNNILPAGQGVVSGSGAGTVFTITAMWDEQRSGNNGTDCDPSDANDLRCFSIRFQL